MLSVQAEELLKLTEAKSASPDAKDMTSLPSAPRSGFLLSVRPESECTTDKYAVPHAQTHTHTKNYEKGLSL